MDKYGYVFAAFVIVWVALAAYIFMMGQEQKRFRKEIDQLKSLIGKNQKS
ncbi:MAG: CcmD family protein [Dehalococcoidales bacterium]|nr:CcmD family protein [Dehalococcoidales bacterium]